MSRYFAPGEKVFLTAGIEVLEARVDRIQYGRYVISYRGSGYEAKGRICVSGNRLYRSYDDAATHITRLADENSLKRRCSRGHAHTVWTSPVTDGRCDDGQDKNGQGE